MKKYPAKIQLKYWVASAVLFMSLMLGHVASSYAGSFEQAKRMHDRIAGVPPSPQILIEMANLIEQNKSIAAAELAIQSPSFYNVTLKHWISPWTNEDASIYGPLNDYTATVIGMIRDDADFRDILIEDVLYIGNLNGIADYSQNSNQHYADLEAQHADLSSVLVKTTQSSLLGIPPQATAGVMTTRAAAKSFFKDGTNRAMFRFTLIHHLCTDLEALKDTSIAPDRIRQDLSRSPGGDSRIFNNSCVGCHSGMDPLAQAFAYYEYRYDVDSDPEGESGLLTYNAIGDLDPQTNSRVQAKYLINANNFPFGYKTQDDRWDNYWREGINRSVGWSDALDGFGYGAKSMGEELANSQMFAECQVKKVFKAMCLRNPQHLQDRNAVNNAMDDFVTSNFNIKKVFASTANYCKGE